MLKFSQSGFKKILSFPLVAFFIVACGTLDSSHLSSDDQFKYVNDCGRLLEVHDHGLSLSHVGCVYFSDGTTDFPRSVPMHTQNVELFQNKDQSIGVKCDYFQRDYQLLAKCGDFPMLTIGWVSPSGRVQLNAHIRLEKIAVSNRKTQVIATHKVPDASRYDRVAIGIYPK